MLKNRPLARQFVLLTATSAAATHCTEQPIPVIAVFVAKMSRTVIDLIIDRSSCLQFEAAGLRQQEFAVMIR